MGSEAVSESFLPQLPFTIRAIQFPRRTEASRWCCLSPRS
jgi:hypothetical protein